jgi:hypothetical protein
MGEKGNAGEIRCKVTVQSMEFYVPNYPLLVFSTYYTIIGLTGISYILICGFKISFAILLCGVSVSDI